MSGATVLFHATRREFDAFDEAFAGTESENAGNSALGIWFATTPDWISGFGARIIEAEVLLGHSYPMTVTELRRLSTLHSSTMNDTSEAAERAAWISQRDSLLARGYDSVAIVEGDGRCDMHVVLRATSVLSIRDISPLCGPSPAGP